MSGQRGSKHGTGAPVRGTPGRGIHRSTRRRQSHTTSRTRWSQSHSQAGTLGRQGHITSRTPVGQSHIRTPGTLGVGRIEKNIRSDTQCQTSSTYSRYPTAINTTTCSSSSKSEDEAGSEDRNFLNDNIPQHTPEPQTSTPLAQSETSVTPGMQHSTRHSHSYPEPALRVNDHCALFQSHEQEIGNQAVTQLNTHQPPVPLRTPIYRCPAAHPLIPVQSQSLTSLTISELANQVTQLCAAPDLEQADRTGEEARAVGTYSPA